MLLQIQDIEWYKFELGKIEQMHREIGSEESRILYQRVKEATDKMIFLIKFVDACNDETKREDFFKTIMND